MNNSTFQFSNFHLLAAIIFIFLNLIFHSFSSPDAIYVHGADASRYYSSAMSLINGNGFGSILGAGPIYPLFLALHYSILGFDYGNVLLVASQSLLLYTTGFIAGKLALKLSTDLNGWLVLALVIFNPNSLITAHLVQTETLFTLFFVTYLYLFAILFKKGKYLLFLSLFAVLVSLTRPAGMYVMVLFFVPAFIFALNNSIRWRRFIYINAVYYLVLSIGLGLWALNNSLKYGEFFISANQSSVMNDQYIALLQYGKGMSQIDAQRRSDNVFKKVVAEKNLECPRGLSSLECKNDVSRAYIKAIFDEKPLVLLNAVSTSVLSVMFSGGASNFANYFGIENKNAVHFHEKSEGGMLSYSKAFDFIKSVNIKYLIALLLFWGFSLIIKILMMFGIWSIFKNSINIHIMLSLSFFVLLFIAEYMFLGQSRWRVPLDPFFIIIASQGIYYISHLFKRK
jgi:hypothetical protein